MALPSVIDEVQRLFEELVHKPWGSAAVLVPASVRESEDGWIVELPSQGLAAKDIRIQVRGGMLLVSGEKQIKKQSLQAQRFQRSAARVAFERTIPLPKGAAHPAIDAKVEGDTLILHLRRQDPKSGDIS